MSAETDNIGIPVIQQPASRTCWSCGEMRAAHFCSSCGKLQPPGPVDYFSFFGLPRKLDLDLAALERDFYKLSRNLHPDIYASATPREQQWSLEKTSQLNDAYRTLKNPIARTAYLLELEGVKLEEQSAEATAEARASGGQKKQVVPPDLLEEVFEFNMQLEELRASQQVGGADAETAEQIRHTREQLQQKLASLDEELRRRWQQWDALIPAGQHAPPQGPQRNQLRDQMKDLLNRRSYIRNLVRDVNQALND